VETGRSSPLFRATFPLLQVNGSPAGLATARAIAESTMDYTSFTLNVYAIALNATRLPDGSWWLGYFDPVRKAMTRYSGTENAFSPADLVVLVAPDGSVRAEWP
jgi:hypothetical protein